MSTYLVIALGSALGGMARYWSSGLIATHVGETFPVGTLVVNVLGSFIIGFIATLTAPDGRLFVSSDTRVFFLIGICGGFTTFSSFSIQTLEMLRDGEWLRAGAYIALSVVLCLVAVWLGYIAATAINNLKGS
jgi:CrcB protein